MKNNSAKTVYLVEILNGGHREAFMQLFARSLLDSGHRVVCIMPDTGVVERWLREHCSGSLDRLSFYQASYPHPGQAVVGKWNTLRAYSGTWWHYRRVVQDIEKRSRLKPDLVFFNCIDGHLANYFPAQLVDLLFPYRWAGLYFHPNHLRLHPGIFEATTGISDVDHALTARNCVAVTVHDEGIVSGFSKRLKGKPVLLFPEIADTTSPDPNNTMAREIREHAGGRIIVGMIGLEPYKGCFEMMQLAKVADPSRFFFAFCGNFGDHLFSFFNNEEQAREFREFRDNLPEHCYWKTGYLTEGAEYNAVFNAFDIVFLVYRKFYSSSNRLTKAACFHKLVMAGDKYCVGEDVLRYDLGAAVPDTQPATLLQGLEQLESRIRSGSLPLANWKVYAGKHSDSVLGDKFREILELCR